MGKTCAERAVDMSRRLIDRCSHALAPELDARRAAFEAQDPVQLSTSETAARRALSQRRARRAMPRRCLCFVRGNGNAEVPSAACRERRRRPTWSNALAARRVVWTQAPPKTHPPEARPHQACTTPKHVGEPVPQVRACVDLSPRPRVAQHAECFNQARYIVATTAARRLGRARYLLPARRLKPATPHRRTLHCRPFRRETDRRASRPNDPPTSVSLSPQSNFEAH